MGKELLKARGGYFNAKGGFTEKRNRIGEQLDFKKRIWKSGRDEPTCGAAGGDADMENTRVDPLGEGAGGMNPDSGVGRYAGPRARETASGHLLRDSNRGPCDHPEGWGGVGRGRGAQEAG